MTKLLVKILIPLVVVTAVVVPVAVVMSRQEAEGPMVNTTLGTIRGRVSEDGTHDIYLGIPYALVNMSNPFGPAITNPTFTDVFNAYDDTVRCLQTDMSQSVIGSLDCLKANILVPRTRDKKPLPVLVYIHGGRFMLGSSAYERFGSKFLVRHDVVYVSFHYRVTAYGFMCLRTPEVPGNQGLKDQLAALRWVKRHIRAFGGDDENITIFGDSAGGVTVDMQLLYADEGLFHKVILQSGTSLSPWGVEEPDLDAPFKISRELGFETGDLDAAMSFLSRESPERVIVAATRLFMFFTPCVEKVFPNVESFMTTHPVNTPASKAKRVPIIAGYNDDEKMFTYANMADEEFQTLDIFESNMRLGFAFNETHEAMKGYVRRFYAGDEPMSSALRHALADFESDFLYDHPTQRSLAKYLDAGGVAYHYVFSYVGGRNMMRLRWNITIGGACHADELGYLFDKNLIDWPPTEDDQLIVDRITTLWTNFAKYGDPTPTPTELLPIKWEPISKESLNYLNLTKELEMRSRPFHQRLSFWDLFYDTYQEYVRGYVSEV